VLFVGTPSQGSRERPGSALLFVCAKTSQRCGNSMTNSIPAPALLKRKNGMGWFGFGRDAPPAGGVCFSCNGTGKYQWTCPSCAGAGGHATTCPKCQGERSVVVPSINCPLCCGWGRVESHQCPKCLGTGELRMANRLQCNRCTGHGEIVVPCSRCRGNAQRSETCRKCQGTGQYHPSRVK